MKKKTQKRFRLLTTLLAAILFAAFSINVYAAQSNIVTQDGITAQLFTDKNSYAAEEKISATVSIENKTGREVYMAVYLSVPEKLVLANESTVYEVLLQNGDSWINPDGDISFIGAQNLAGVPPTGDKTQVGLWITASVVAVIGIAALFIYGKNSKTWLSMLLCLVMLGGMVTAAIPVQAATGGNIELSCSVKVDGKDETVAATIVYHIYEEDDDNDTQVLVPTPSATPAPSTTPEPSATPVPGENTGDGNKDYTQPESGEGINVLLDDDFEEYTISDKKYDKPLTAKGWTGQALNDTAAMKVVEENAENQVYKAYHGDPAAEGATARSPRVEYLVKGDYTNITLDMDVKISEGSDKFNVILYQNDTGKTRIGSLVSLAHADCEEWTHIKIMFDLENNTQTIYVGGVQKEQKTYTLTPNAGFKLYFSANVAADTDDSYVYIDNALITTTDEIDEGIVAADGATINWDKVILAENEKTGLMDVMDASHPRIYVNDWDEMKAKVAADNDCRSWYDTIIAFADSYLTKEPVTYVRNSRGNINDCSTAFKNNIIPVAAAACLTTDTNKQAEYKARVYEELEAIGNWPDWGSDAYLCTAHIIFAYAVCYDWMYDQWTEPERTNIENWMLNKGMSQAILNYEGYTTSTTDFTTSKINWNNVCNGSNMVGAIALAGELTGDYAGVADYVITKAAKAIPYSFVDLTEDGAYAEPLSYWDYGIRHQVKLMAALNSCLKTGESLPAVLDFGNVNAADAAYKAYAVGMSNTGAFPIYYNGTTGGFNYGDGIIDLVVSPIMYWLSNEYNKPEFSWYNLYMMNNNDNVEKVTAKDAALSLIWYEPENSSVPADGFDLDRFYQSYISKGTNGISMRSSWEDENALYVAVHAGDETVSHSNLDAGGFVLDWNNQRWVHMYGRNPGGYTNTYGLADYNTKTETGRYQYYNTRGEANNTIIAYASSAIANNNIPIVDMDIDYFAAVERYESGVNTSYGIVDMTDTNSALYTSAKRGVMLTGYRDIVVVQDEITAKEPSDFYWFVNTNADITISADGKSALWEMNGDRMLVRITQALVDQTENSNVKFGIMNAETLDFVTLDPTKTQVEINEHKMYIHASNATYLNLTVEFVPLEDGEGISAPLTVKPLTEWNVEQSANMLTSQILGDIVAVLPGSPNAYVKGAKTQIGAANTIKDNDTVYVPSDFVTDVFGGHALSATDFGGISYVSVNDAAAAFGKIVTTDSTYGLVFIADKTVSYDAVVLEKIYDLLDIRVFYTLQEKVEVPQFQPNIMSENFEGCTAGTKLSESQTGLEVTTDKANMVIAEEEGGNKVAQTGGVVATGSVPNDQNTSRIIYNVTPDMLTNCDKLEISMNVLVEGTNKLSIRARTVEDKNIGNFKNVEAKHMTDDGEMVSAKITFDFKNDKYYLTFNGKDESDKYSTYTKNLSEENMKLNGFLFTLWMYNVDTGDNILVDDIVITATNSEGIPTVLVNEDFESYKNNTEISTENVSWTTNVSKKAESLTVSNVNGDKMIKATHFAKASSHVIKSFSKTDLEDYGTLTICFDTMVKGADEMALNLLTGADGTIGTFKTLKAGVSNFAADTWYSVKIEIDLENDAQTLYLKEKGADTYVAETAKNYEASKNVKLSDGFKLRLNITDKSGTGNGVLLDNFVITGTQSSQAIQSSQGDIYNGEITFFDPEITEYYVQMSKEQELSDVNVQSLDSGRNIAKNAANSIATVEVDGVTYTIHFVENPFEGITGTGSSGVINTISLGLASPPTKPAEQTWISVQGVSSSIGAWEDSANYVEQGTIDGVISTLPINRWSANGHGSWICYDLGSEQSVYSMAIAGYNSSTRQYVFKIEYSTDGESWTTAVEAGETTAGSDREVFALNNVTARYIKVTGVSASNSTWIGINEVRIYSDENMQNADQEAWIAYFYPDTVYGNIGETVALKATGYDAGGVEVPVDISGMTLNSANTDVATVDANGIITLVNTGTTTIRAEMTVFGVTKTASIDVIVQ